MGRRKGKMVIDLTGKENKWAKNGQKMERFNPVMHRLSFNTDRQINGVKICNEIEPFNVRANIQRTDVIQTEKIMHLR